MGKIDLSINKEGLAHNIKKAKENGIIIPTLRHASRCPTARRASWCSHR